MIAEAFDRVTRLFRRRLAARRLGFTFNRAADFAVPDRILVNGQWQRLFLPDENGVKVAFIDLLLDDCYGCRQLGTSIKTVVDIGANVGLFSVAARIAFPEAVIHAYEPNPQLERYLSRQASFARFHCFSEAVGAEAGKVHLNFHHDSVQTRSVTDPSGDIAQVSFGDVVRRIGGQIDLMKLDCEGAEWTIFEDRENWDAVRNLSMEYHLWGGHTHEEAATAVRQRGFTVISQTEGDGFGLIVSRRE